jgi:hypothetical protein
VTEVSTHATGTLRVRSRSGEAGRWSAVSLWMGIISIALAPLFGVGVVPGIASIVVGHIAKHREPQGFVKWTIGLGLSYLAVVVGTAVLVFVALPLTLAFLVSAGYILSD